MFESRIVSSAGLSRTARMRYWKPAPGLAPYVSGYHLYAVESADGRKVEDVFFPAWANLRFVLTPETRWQVRLQRRDWQNTAPVTLFGPSSTVIWSRSTGGVLVGVGLRPRGMFHLLREPAARWANRIDDAKGAVALETGELLDRLRDAQDDESIPRIFDEELARAIAPSPKDDKAIGAIEKAALDSDVESVKSLARRVGMSTRSLQRLTSQAFGFPPRLLVRRARFLRSFDAMRGVGRGQGSAAIDENYVDYSHFVKDANYFLGMSPQTFLALDTPLARQSMALRKQVLGAPVQALGVRDDD